MFFNFALQTPFTLTLQAVRSSCSNADFIQNIEVTVGTDGPVPALNTKYDIVKEIPQDVLVSTNNSLLKYRIQQKILKFDSIIHVRFRVSV
jgi:hypothetical protein